MENRFVCAAEQKGIMQRLLFSLLLLFLLLFFSSNNETKSSSLVLCGVGHTNRINTTQRKKKRIITFFVMESKIMVLGTNVWIIFLVYKLFKWASSISACNGQCALTLCMLFTCISSLCPALWHFSDFSFS